MASRVAPFGAGDAMIHGPIAFTSARWWLEVLGMWAVGFVVGVSYVVVARRLIARSRNGAST